ncbi:hypothetical protein B0H67DRAFT_648511 [Lasiosphaeris hirsuta]|uniref:Uncharacterized protein n=1 Tax=Lasiosphaeris hirsuta TaxID=260670 RepID=A0AA40A378_9PEZI|nr:hypothetical protein B0H67DRAFT_648511 [Lasiosphaeris hirsuta]
MENSASSLFTDDSISTGPSPYSTDLSIPSSYSSRSAFSDRVSGVLEGQQAHAFYAADDEPIYRSQHVVGPALSPQTQTQMQPSHTGVGKFPASNEMVDIGELFTGYAASPDVDSGQKSPAAVSIVSAVKRSDLSSVVSGDQSSPSTDDTGSQTSTERTGASDTFEFWDVTIDGSRFSSIQSEAVWALTVAYNKGI